MKLLIEIERRRGLLEGSVLFPDGKGYSLESPFFEPSLAEPPPRVVSEMARLIEIVMRPAAAQEHKELDDLLPDNLVNRSQAAQAAMEIARLFKCLQDTRDHHAAEVAENGKLRDRIDLLERENEKLARLVPSAPFGAEMVPAARLGNPPVEGTVFGTPSGVSALDGVPPVTFEVTFEVVGQQWCR